MKLRKVQRRLNARVASYEDTQRRVKRGFKRPGSMNPHKSIWPLGKKR